MSGGVAQRPRAAEQVDRDPAPDVEERPAVRVPLWWLVAAVAVLAVPFVVALVVQHEPRWYPVGDSAQIELRVRDVFSTSPPLIGLGGRIGGGGIAQGSHPGPLAFYAMAPLHRLLGDTAWGFQVATAFVQTAALVASLWLVRRRGGPLLFLGAATALALVVAALTADLLTVPWNPYLPLLWLGAFVVAVWSVTCDDLAALPVAVFAGAMCAQTHVPYTGVVAVGSLVVVGWVAFRLWRPAAAGWSRRRVAVAAGATAALAAVLWFPPVLEQLTEDSGNLARVIDYFLHPPGDTYGFGHGLRLLLVRLDPWRLLTDRNPDVPFAAGSSLVPGTVLVVAWALSVVTAWRLRAAVLLRLHLVVALAVVASGLAFSRIYGPPFAYLSLWTLCLTALLLVAVGWTVGLVVGRLLPAATADRLAPVVALAFVVVFVGVSATATAKASSAEPTERAAGRVLGGLTEDTVDALRAGELPGTGEDGTYFMTGRDPTFVGAVLHGLANELERAGLRARGDEALRVVLRPDRVVTPDEATAEVHVAVGPTAAEDRPGAVAVARFDPHDGPDGERYDRIRAEAVRRLEQVGAPDLARQVEEVAVIVGDPRVDADTRDLLNQLRELGVPATVFVGPPPTD